MTLSAPIYPLSGPHIYNTRTSVLRTLLYFDLFRHPLTTRELAEYNLQTGVTEQEIQDCVAQLRDKGLVYTHKGFVMLHDDEEMATRRIKGNEMALQFMDRAQRFSKLISLYPFVRGVLLSGSISKGYMDTHSDIDYFIVTEQKRLWICRSMLAVTRKLMPGRMRKNFCINYFIDTTSLEIPDKNIFTATELSFLRPTYGHACYRQLLEHNRWIRDYYPNRQLNNHTLTEERSVLYGLKKLAEKILGGTLGEKLDTLLFRMMLKRWKKKYKGLDESDFDLDYRTRRNVSKQHHKSHQTVIMERYASRIEQFERTHHIVLN